MNFSVLGQTQFGPRWYLFVKGIFHQNMMKIWYIKTKTFFRITEIPTEWLKDRATDRLSDDRLTYQPTDWLTT